MDSFAPLLQLNILLGFHMVLENTLRHKFQQSAPKSLYNLVNELSARHLTLHLPDPARKVPKLQIAKDALESNFDLALTEILDGHFMPSLTPLERGFAVAPALRNLGAHKITSNAVVGQRFDDILQLVFSAICGTVELAF